MNLETIIGHVADEADELLGGCTTVEQARLELQDHIKASYPALSAAESKGAVAGVIKILQKEGFFEGIREEAGFGDEGSDGFSQDNEV